MTQIIVDTGPLVAVFDCDSRHHGWAVEQFKRIENSLLTCEAVLAETVFLMRRDGLDPDWLFDLISRGEVRCDFDFASERDTIRSMFRRYRDRAISIADASLVRMSELHPDSVIFTIDHDFLIYRRNGRKNIPLIAPFD